MLPSLGSQGANSVDFVDCLLCFPIPIKSFVIEAGFTFITIGWTPASGLVIVEVYKNHNLSEEPNKGSAALCEKACNKT